MDDDYTKNLKELFESLDDYSLIERRDSGNLTEFAQKLVEEESVFTEIGAYVMGSFDPGLLVVSGKVQDGVSLEDAEAKVWEVINELLALCYRVDMGWRSRHRRQ